LDTNIKNKQMEKRKYHQQVTLLLEVEF